MRATEPWHSFPREVVESPLLEMFKSHLDKFLGNWLQVALMSRGFGPENFRRSLPNSTIL